MHALFGYRISRITEQFQNAGNNDTPIESVLAIAAALLGKLKRDLNPLALCQFQHSGNIASNDRGYFPALDLADKFRRLLHINPRNRSSNSASVP